MSFKVSVLVAAVFLFLVVAVNSKTKEGEKCSIADHIQERKETEPWTINPHQNIYGNGTAEPRISIVSTWGNNSALEAAINEQINRELFAHYTYLSMAVHFGRDDNYLPGFAKFFREAAEEEHKHAMMFMDYQNKRGGRVKLHPIKEPCEDEWGNGLMAMKKALKLERIIYTCLINVHNVAENLHDHQMTDYIEANFLNEQIDSINLLGRHIGSLQRLGNGVGEYQFDKLTLGGK